MFLYLFRASESSQQRQGARRAEEMGRSAVDVYFHYISCQTHVIAFPGPPDPWAAIAKIGSSAWAEGRVLGSLQHNSTINFDSYSRMLQNSNALTLARCQRLLDVGKRPRRRGSRGEKEFLDLLPRSSSSSPRRGNRVKDL
ncbi:hypothetical protein Taro_013490 [Colocasia esculenta]|uniref:Uncharacterized protein n=1 Tax=Colocasia esculenta TaxID=4460 RepID=A0A843UG42_COLES|nr:hypothetical protein [Colocasia esculenta]